MAEPIYRSTQLNVLNTKNMSRAISAPLPLGMNITYITGDITLTPEQFVNGAVVATANSNTITPPDLEQVYRYLGYEAAYPQTFLFSVASVAGEVQTIDHAVNGDDTVGLATGTGQGGASLYVIRVNALPAGYAIIQLAGPAN